MEEALKQGGDASLDNYKTALMDKYLLGAVPDKWTKARKIVFMPGHNRMDVASVENITRLAFEDEEILIKPHPLTDDGGMAVLGRSLGWNRIIPKDISGFELLKKL